MYLTVWTCTNSWFSSPQPFSPCINFFLWLGFSLFGLFGEICLCLQDLIEVGRGQCSLVDFLFFLLKKNRMSSPSGLFTIVSELIVGTLHP